MKRVWDSVAVESSPESTGEPGTAGYAVHLDGRPMRLPGGSSVLLLPNLPMAETVADEWARAGNGAKGGEFTVLDLPLTRLAATAQDRIAPGPAPTVAALAAYGETDLLCYRAERPEQLVLRQAAAWQPWLDWAHRTFGAQLHTSSGITHVKQAPAALAALHRAVAALDPWTLAGLGVAVPSLGSLVLGLALQARELDAPGAHALAELDATFQAELWGEDAEAAARSAAVLRDVSEAAQFMRLARPTLQ